MSACEKETTTMHGFFPTAVAIVTCCFTSQALAAEPLPIYQPKVKMADIYFHHPGAKPVLKYNHDVDIVKFKGRFFAAWNANEATCEDVPGQYNFLSVSDDFEHCSAPVRLFTRDAAAENPVETDNQWQPCFINWRDETLVCAWCDYNARKTYIATSTDGVRWNNREVPTAAEAFGMTQVVSPIPRSTARTRAAFATTYALGQLHLVPWDLYMGSDATGIQPRYFGTREQYGDLCDFVHTHPALFDDHESAAEIAVLANADAPDSGSLAQFCRQLARQQLPFHLLLGGSRYARLPLRAADLRAARVVVEFNAADTFGEADQQTIRAARESGLVRFIPPTADLVAMAKLRGLELLRVEAPEGVYAFPRVNRSKRSAAVHLVNWNLDANGERAERYQNVTLTLRQPPRWGKIATATWLEPGREPVALQPECHADCVRLTLPQIETWGVVEIQ